jgi:hypothetical protein
MSYRYADACSMALHFGEKEWQEKRQKESHK